MRVCSFFRHTPDLTALRSFVRPSTFLIGEEVPESVTIGEMLKQVVKLHMEEVKVLNQEEAVEAMKKHMQMYGLAGVTLYEEVEVGQLLPRVKH